MYFTILDKNNSPIMSAKLDHFSLHTSACESYIERINYSAIIPTGECNAVYNALLQDVIVLNEELLLQFEEQHRLDNTKYFGNSKGTLKDSSNRDFYVFIQPVLRGDFSWNITQSGYRDLKTKVLTIDLQNSIS